jgi:CubicO group peptidase (beta-lactamase class C family)
MFKEAVEEGQIPGAVALIARNGKIIFHKAYGMSNTAAGDSMKPVAIFRVAPQTKALLLTAVMMLWEEGEFRLDDPVSKYIAECSETQILDTFNDTDRTYTTKPAEDQNLIRDLITHTSGIGYGVIDGDQNSYRL